MRQSRFKPERTGVGAPLGDLESVVMQHVWAIGDRGCLASNLMDALEHERPIALTTLLTTLDRLHDKGIVRRNKEGKAYRYYPAMSQEQLEQRIVEGVMNNLIVRFPKAVATYFAQGASDAVDLTELAAKLQDLQSKEG